MKFIQYWIKQGIEEKHNNNVDVILTNHIQQKGKIVSIIKCYVQEFTKRGTMKSPKEDAKIIREVI